MPFGAADQATSRGAAVAAAMASAKPSNADEGKGEVDLSGVDPGDVQLIVSQLRCTEQEAAKALRENNNDIVEAILQITA